jgi:hypothetical protein
VDEKVDVAWVVGALEQCVALALTGGVALGVLAVVAHTYVLVLVVYAHRLGVGAGAGEVVS